MIYFGKFIAACLLIGLALAPFILIARSLVAEYVWPKLNKQARLCSILALSAAMLFVLWFSSLRTWGIEVINVSMGNVETIKINRNAWGQPTEKWIYLQSGYAHGPVDKNRNKHGKWLYNGNAVWYYHGERCTKSDFHK